MKYLGRSLLTGRRRWVRTGVDRRSVGSERGVDVRGRVEWSERNPIPCPRSPLRYGSLGGERDGGSPEVRKVSESQVSKGSSHYQEGSLGYGVSGMSVDTRESPVKGVGLMTDPPPPVSFGVFSRFPLYPDSRT